MEKICEERHKGIDKQLETIVTRLNNHSERIDAGEQKMVAQEKDTFRLEGAILALQGSIDKLIAVVDSLKAKPLEKYEKVAWVIATAFISYFVGKLL